MSGAIAVLVENEYQDLEVWYPVLRFREAGFQSVVVGNGQPSYKGKYGTTIQVDKQINQVKPEDFLAVIIPGGWAPERIRMSPAMVAFVKKMYEQGKIVASICHGGWVL